MPSLTYPYTIPQEAAAFVESQFHRFAVQVPSPAVVNDVGELVVSYVHQRQFYPSDPQEAEHRFRNPGLSEFEKRHVLEPIEYRVRIERGQYCDIRVLELATWASLLWCWSEDGVQYVSWFRNAQNMVEQAKVAVR